MSTGVIKSDELGPFAFQYNIINDGRHGDVHPSRSAPPLMQSDLFAWAIARWSMRASQARRCPSAGGKTMNTASAAWSVCLCSSCQVTAVEGSDWPCPTVRLLLSTTAVWSEQSQKWLDVSCLLQMSPAGKKATRRWSLHPPRCS